MHEVRCNYKPEVATFKMCTLCSRYGVDPCISSNGIVFDCEVDRLVHILRNYKVELYKKEKN